MCSKKTKEIDWQMKTLNSQCRRERELLECSLHVFRTCEFVYVEIQVVNEATI